MGVQVENEIPYKMKYNWHIEDTQKETKQESGKIDHEVTCNQKTKYI